MGTIVAARQVGQNVRHQRKELGLTQRQLAEQAGVSERSIISLELGDATGIRLDKLLSILSALGLTMSIQSEGISTNPTSPSAQTLPSGQSSGLSSASGPVLAFLQQAQRMSEHLNQSR